MLNAKELSEDNEILFILLKPFYTFCNTYFLRNFK